MRAWDTIWGHGVADLVIENSYVDITQERDRARAGRRSSAEGQVLARLSAQGRRRGDQREHPDGQAAARRPAPCLRARRLPGRRADLRRVPRLREVSRPARRRPAADRQRQGLRRDASRSATANLQFEGTGVRLDKIDIRRAPAGDRRRLGRLGRQLFLRRQRHQDPGRVAGSTMSFPRAPLSGIARLRRERHRHLRQSALRRQASARDLFAGDEGIGQVSRDIFRCAG